MHRLYCTKMTQSAKTVFWKTLNTSADWHWRTQWKSKEPPKYWSVFQEAWIQSVWWTFLAALRKDTKNTFCSESWDAFIFSSNQKSPKITSKNSRIRQEFHWIFYRSDKCLRDKTSQLRMLGGFYQCLTSQPTVQTCSRFLGTNWS